MPNTYSNSLRSFIPVLAVILSTLLAGCDLDLFGKNKSAEPAPPPVVLPTTLSEGLTPEEVSLLASSAESVG